jgi:hypothetical protein
MLNFFVKRQRKKLQLQILKGNAQKEGADYVSSSFNKK